MELCQCGFTVDATNPSFAHLIIPFASCFYQRHFTIPKQEAAAVKWGIKPLFTSFLTPCVLSCTLNITPFAHLRSCSRSFYVWVLLYPTGMVAGGCICLSACFLFVCRWGEGGWCLGGGWGFGHRGNKPVPGRKTASFLPLCFHPPLSSLLHQPHPQQPPSVFMPLIHLLCDDAPPAVGGCAASRQKHKDGGHLVIEKKLRIYTV